jgi:MshEN domain
MGLDYKLLTRSGAVHVNGDGPASPPGLDPPPDVLRLIPESLARLYRILPIAFDGETITVATSSPNDLLFRDQLSLMLARGIKFVPAPPGVIEPALDRCYGRHETESVNSYMSEPGEAVCVEEVGGPPRKKRAGPFLGRTITEFKRGVKGLEEDLAAENSISDLAGTVSSDPRYPGLDTTPPLRKAGMFHYVVEEGQRALVMGRDGRMEVVVGPKRVRTWGKAIRPMKHYVAHPGEFLVVRYRDGRQEHLPGPAELWFDPRIHLTIARQDALQVAAREAVVVYSRATDGGPVGRRIVYGPTLFVPAPGEWLHTFAWHGAEGGSEGAPKVAKGLVFQKLWLMPDQMYHDVTDVRTADDAVLTLRLMIFFELLDIERMLDTTHDPIGDFINAATSDVVDFTGRHSFEGFKQNTSRLNDLDTYRQLMNRAAQCGYQINKVVYRGYGAPDRLQAMHDQAIEARTKLQLERATEQQAQELEDYKLRAQMARAVQRRTEQTAEVEAELELTRRRAEADLRGKEAVRAALRDQRRADAAAAAETRTAVDARQREHLAGLKEMGVDLTAYLTQGRADRVIELRGANGTHVHLDRVEGNGRAD